MPSNVFQLLHPKVQSGLEANGITEPTPPQEKAIEPILEGENVLLIAPTASGKTEAALLPVLSQLLDIQEKEGIGLLYITPLRALNRDMHKRFMYWADHLEFDVQIRHGDTSQKMRRRQVINPPKILITTPETLQAILPSKMNQHLRNVRFVIIDEIHDLAASKRGAQLTLGLERLNKLTEKPPQRIGLSATVGNPVNVAQFLSKNTRILEVEVDKHYTYTVEFPKPGDADFDSADDLSTTPQAASRLRRIQKLVQDSKSTLIFVQGRGQAETIGNRLKRLDPAIEVHHGSLSREQRHMVEDQFKAGELKGIVCTSTLQLGIDIGSVDLTIQYLSPRQVSALIQRVGRAGHTLKQKSEGVLIAAYGEDALESLVTAERARRKDVEDTLIHMKPLDVLSHQLVGLSLDYTEIPDEDAYNLVKRAYPFRELTMDELQEVLYFLSSIAIISYRDGIIKRRKKGRMYYYENLGMINDERRYPFIDAVTDRIIGTVGDEFWTLRARVGLTVILKGRVWKILQIDDERGVLHVVPAEDPLAAHPGWDGELISVPIEVASDVGALRAVIEQEIGKYGAEETVITLAGRYNSDISAMSAAVEEVRAQIAAGFPVPTDKQLLLEGYRRFLVIHSSYGERVNRTLGAILDALLSEHDLIYSWWNDPYRILVEAPRKLDKFDLEKISDLFKAITEKEAEAYLNEFIETRFPFGYRMKFIAERFGVIPRGKLMGPERLENLYIRFKDTPIHKETLREVNMEILDLDNTKQILNHIKEGEITLSKKLTKEASPLSRHILEKYADVAELMESKLTSENQLDYMKKSLGSRKITLACMNCAEWTDTSRLREIQERPTCQNCGSGLLASLYRNQNPDEFLTLLKRFKHRDPVSDEAKEILTKARKSADLILSYGSQAIISMSVRGIGPVTSYQILSRMIQDEKEFYAALLKAKIQYMKTRQYWEK